MAFEIRQVSGYEELARRVETRNEVAQDDTGTVALKVLLPTSLFAWARPWQHHGLYVSLGYEPRTASIDFQGALL